MSDAHELSPCATQNSEKVPSPAEEDAPPSPSRPCEEVVIPQPGEDPWKWAGERGLALTGYGAFVLAGSPYCRYAVRACPQDFRATFGETGRELSVAGRYTAVVRPAVLIPRHLLVMAGRFFYAAWSTYRTEDILLLYFFPQEGRYELEHPPLVCADAVGVGYEFPPTPVDAILFGSLHSHPESGAHHSDTDTMDVRGVPGVHIVLGDLDRLAPSIVCVLSTPEAWHFVDPGNVCEQPVDLAGPLEPVEFPAAWLRRPPALPTYISRQRRIEGKQVKKGETHGADALPATRCDRTRGDL